MSRSASRTKGMLLGLATIFLALVFIASAIAKLMDPARFLLDVQAFQLLPYPLAYAATLLVPWLELVCAVALFLRPLASAAAAIMALLTASFIGIIASAWHRGLQLDCGCFGDWLVFPNFGSHIAFNTVLLALLVWLLAARWPGSKRRQA